ncbi:MAG: PqqD family peptide modification chaperone [Thiogranum sp.]
MNQLNLSTTIADDVHSYLLGDELLLFSQRARAMFRLNPSAALIWFCCEEGLDRQAIIAELRQMFKLPAAQAEKDVDAVLTEWETRGLLAQDTETLPPPEERDELPSLREVPAPTSVVKEYQRERRYQMLGTVFRIRFSVPELEPVAQTVLAHLAVPDNQPFDVALDVQQDSLGCFLFCNGELVDHCTSEEELAPLLHGQALLNAYSRADCLTAIHAAAVSNGETCIVFPASSGSGKSTLTAALIASEFQYCTDELVLLKRRTHTIQAAAAGIGVKSDAWQVLQPLHPILKDLPTFLRQDAKQVRYLLPPKHLLANDTAQCYPVQSLVFPSYQPEQPTSLSRISPADALCRLTEAGYDMEGGLDTERVAELVSWIGGINCYELLVHDLQEAVSRIQDLLK